MSKPSLTARLLAPCGSIFGELTSRRMKRQGFRSALPVLCVGNFVVGGAGKTPAAIAIARQLLARGEKPVFLSRGYRGKLSSTPCEVDILRHTAEDVGDEALLLARVAPTIIGGDRAASARSAEAIGASVLILDDGLQNPSLSQDLRLAVVDAKTGIGNGLCIPAGPLRAPIADQLAGVTALLLVGAGDAGARLSEQARNLGKPVLNAQIVAEKQIGGFLSGERVFGFAGIGLPDKFHATLQQLGADIVGWQSFPDHHAYSAAILRRLQMEAARKDAYLVTTEKDFVRIAPLLGKLDKMERQPIAVPVNLMFGDEAALDSLLIAAINARQPMNDAVRASS